MELGRKKALGINLLAIYFGWRGVMAILYVFSMICAPQIIGKIMDWTVAWEIAFPYNHVSNI